MRVNYSLIICDLKRTRDGYYLVDSFVEIADPRQGPIPIDMHVARIFLLLAHTLHIQVRGTVPGTVNSHNSQFISREPTTTGTGQMQSVHEFV